MSNNPGTQWRFVVVEDKPDFVRQLKEILPTCVDSPDSVAVDVHATFGEAAKQLGREKYDVIILDLKDDSSSSIDAEDEPAGLKIFEELKKTRFMPVVFYTALAHKVRSEETSFVRVVEKTESISKVKEEVKRVLATQLPALSRQLEEIQRSYMWDFVSKHWKDFPQSSDQADIAHLLARRLAIALETEANKFAAKVGGGAEFPTGKIHPMAMYIVPTMGPHPMAGDIVSETLNGTKTYWLIITPSCDFAQTKVDHVTLAKCEHLVDRDEFKKWSQNKNESNRTRLENLIGDGRSDRFKFLPRAFFIPDLVVDFQQLRCVPKDSLKDLEQVATLDSPYAESVLARFSRYFNRLGTPDLDKSVILNRLEADSNQPTREQPNQPPKA